MSTSPQARGADSLYDVVLQALLAARQDVMACIARGGGVGPHLARADADIAEAAIALRADRRRDGSP
jgi:hypothetical protein